MSDLSQVMFGLAVATGLTGLMFDTAAKFAPRPDAASFIQIAEFSVDDVQPPANAAFHMERQILRDTFLRTTAVVHHKTPTGWNPVCYAESGWAQVRAGSNLPDDIKIRDWFRGSCPALPVGQIEICVTYEFRAPGNPLTTVCSNVFEVRDATD